MNKDKFDKILGLIGVGGFALALAIQDWQIRDLNARVRRLETQENLRSISEMAISEIADSLKTRKKED